jgi:hypothetical protein
MSFLWFSHWIRILSRHSIYLFSQQATAWTIRGSMYRRGHGCLCCALYSKDKERSKEQEQRQNNKRNSKKKIPRGVIGLYLLYINESSILALVHPLPPIQRVPGSFPSVKRPRNNALNNIDVKKEWSYTSTPSTYFMAWKLRVQHSHAGVHKGEAAQLLSLFVLQYNPIVFVSPFTWCCYSQFQSIINRGVNFILQQSEIA